MSYMKRITLSIILCREGNPLPSCQAVYEKDPNSRSGPYWLMVNGVKFKVTIQFDFANSTAKN